MEWHSHNSIQIHQLDKRRSDGNVRGGIRLGFHSHKRGKERSWGENWDDKREIDGNDKWGMRLGPGAQLISKLISQFNHNRGN